MASITPGGSVPTNVANLYTKYLNKDIVQGLKEDMQYAPFAMPATLPENAGHYIARWMVPDYDEVTSPSALDNASSFDATEGEITPTNIPTVEATIGEYGEWFTMSRLSKRTLTDGTLDTIKDQLMYRGSSSIDHNIRNEIYNNASQFYGAQDYGSFGTASTTIADGEFLTAKDIPFIVRGFRTQKAKGFREFGGDFVLIHHVDLEADLVTESTTGRITWTDTFKHTPQGFDALVDNHQISGRFHGMTLLRTTRVKQDTAGIADAYWNVALARDGVGWLGLGGGGPKEPQFIMQTAGPNDVSNPLRRKNTMGFLYTAVARQLDAKRTAIVLADVA